ncbi:uncharacterized protein CMU_034320 [Cryptosporidium muris RN66]|uniref:Uncharacterized protein n=1 Tax=Cryptosporidium muris (strain RN66) TaxID=441375 RepID=B6AFQ5_CRYMR|nr:uncharacterized protein CMU_034320 [Cryptosporidium muris RN66]EEA07046.1 hypothetical protein CMU_034320 [Cryptosporidium muris RN66]|eukprot:XP_002141395.1 hypothetical protein [Cryptosporidium muris RN66]
MFLIERALNIFSFVYTVEARHQATEVALGVASMVSNSHNVTSAKPNNPRFIPNNLQTTIPASRLEFNQQDKTIYKIPSEGPPLQGKIHTISEQWTTPTGSISSPSSLKTPIPTLKAPESPISVTKELVGQATLQYGPTVSSNSSFVSQTSPSRAIRFIPNNSPKTVIPNERTIKYQYYATNPSIPSSSPRYIRINSNLVDHSVHLTRRNNEGVNIWNSTTGSSSPETFRAVSPNFQQYPVQIPKVNLQSPAPDLIKGAVNPQFTVVPNPSINQYLDHITTRKAVSPMETLILASPSYKRNVVPNVRHFSINTVVPHAAMQSQSK